MIMLELRVVIMPLTHEFSNSQAWLVSMYWPVRPCKWLVDRVSTTRCNSQYCKALHLLAPYKACYIRDHGKHDLFDFFLHPLAKLALTNRRNRKRTQENSDNYSTCKRFQQSCVNWYTWRHRTAMEDIFFFHISFTPIL